MFPSIIIRNSNLQLTYTQLGRYITIKVHTKVYRVITLNTLVHTFYGLDSIVKSQQNLEESPLVKTNWSKLQPILSFNHTFNTAIQNKQMANIPKNNLTLSHLYLSTLNLSAIPNKAQKLKKKNYKEQSKYNKDHRLFLCT